MLVGALTASLQVLLFALGLVPRGLLVATVRQAAIALLVSLAPVVLLPRSAPACFLNIARLVSVGALLRLALATLLNVVVLALRHLLSLGTLACILQATISLQLFLAIGALLTGAMIACR